MIFDEIHHAGDSLDWGIKLKQAFGNAEYRLGLSGTPFRSDDNRIPFVRYENRTSQAEFTYGYGQALIDSTCRPIYFPTIEGNVSWIRGSGERVDCTLLDEMPRRKSAERLRTALDPGGDWLRDVLQEADSKLTEIRFGGHPDAAGLIIAIDQYHARRISELMKVITNEEPVVAISDEDDSSRRIAAFARQGNRRRWIVAVKMVSEGVDIPRLRVGVYATTVTSELFFRQAVGRFLRMVAELDEQSAVFYMPADKMLIEHALSIRDERDHHLPEKIISQPAGSSPGNQFDRFPAEDIRLINSGQYSEIPGILMQESDFGKSTEDDYDPADDQTFDGINRKDQNAADRASRRNFIVPLGAEARRYDTVFDGQRFTSEELSAAEQIGRQIGAKIPPAQVAAIVRLAGVNSTSEENNQIDVQVKDSGDFKNNSLGGKFTTKSDRKKRLRKKIQKQVGRLGSLTGRDYGDFHKIWIEEMSGQAHSRATEVELQKKLDWLEEQIAEVQADKYNRRKPQ